MVKKTGGIMSVLLYMEFYDDPFRWWILQYAGRFKHKNYGTWRS